ncbi:MAG: hypothetical protein AABX59_01970 [Nanoarchaeota archaeon]
MEIQIKEKFSNPLLEREEVIVIVSSPSTPNSDELRKALAHKFNSSEDLVSVKHILGSYGMHNFKVEAYIYKNKELFQRFEVKKVKTQVQEEGAEEVKEEIQSKPEKKKVQEEGKDEA